MREEHLAAFHFEAARFRKRSHPPLPLRRGLREGVVVGNLGEVIVAGISVPAVAVRSFRRERFLVVALDQLSSGPEKNREDPVRVGSKRPEIAERVKAVVAPPLSVSERCLERQPVAVNTPEKREGRHVRHVTPYSWQVKQAL